MGSSHCPPAFITAVKLNNLYPQIISKAIYTQIAKLTINFKFTEKQNFYYQQNIYKYINHYFNKIYIINLLFIFYKKHANYIKT